MKIKNILQSEGFYKAIILFGAIGAFLSIVIGWGGLDFFLNIIIRKMMRLIPGTSLWETWKTIPFPVYIKFHLWNITNPQDFAKGYKAKLNEMGPYVYLVDFDKHDFVHNEEIDTVLYSPTRTYIFQQDKSKGNEDDLVTYVNVIFVAVSHIAHDVTDLEILHATLDNMLVEKGEKLTRTDKVRDLLFDGVSIQAYVELAEDPLVQQAGSIELPETFNDGLFAIFKGKNGTKDGRWECHRGIRESSELARLYSYNEEKKLNIYKGDSCNAINGTDGSLNPPFINPGITELYVFIPELCRSMQWEFMKMTKSQNIPVARHRFPDIQTVDENPNMWCFCPYENISKCDHHGIANLAPCFGGAPLLYSKPHFLGASESIRDLVEGLQPRKELHESQLDVHPLTGASITASIKMQFSIELVPWPGMPSFSETSNAIVPFVWIELIASLDGLKLSLIKSLSMFLSLFPVLRWMTFVGSMGLVFIGLFMIYRNRKSNNIADQSNDGDDKSSEKNGNEIWIEKFKSQT